MTFIVVTGPNLKQFRTEITYEIQELRGPDDPENLGLTGYIENSWEGPQLSQKVEVTISQI